MSIGPVKRSKSGNVGLVPIMGKARKALYVGDPLRKTHGGSLLSIRENVNPSMKDEFKAKIMHGGVTVLPRNDKENI